jgi:hypothetical protein
MPGDGATTDAMHYAKSDDDASDVSDDFDSDGPRHVADHYFSDAELEMIKRSWGDSLTFIASYGLKFYDPKDCEEAKAIAQALLERQ